MKNSNTHLKAFLFFLTLVLVLGIPSLRAQELSFELVKDSISGKYGYEEIFEFPGLSKSELKQRSRATISDPKIIILENDDELIIRYTTTVASYRYLKLTEHYSFKDEKIRWMISDMHYLFNVTSGSHFDPLDKVAAKQLKKVIPRINKLFGDGRTNMIQKIKSQSDDW